MTLLTKSPPGVLLGGQAPPRVRHAPRTRANAWEDVSDLCAAFGLVLDEWQETCLQAGLGERSDGRWAARQIGISTPRQNGKTMLIVARVLAGLLLFDEQIIIVSAHRQDTARETFFRLVQLIEDNPSLGERVDWIHRSEMREYIRMKSGQEVRFKARSSGSGRGFSCDCLLLDEAQILGAPAWSAILPTMSARPNPQVWMFGTPPTELDDGEVFERLRANGIEGKESKVAYLEWSADVDDPISEPGTWAKANPAYGTRIDFDAIATELASMSESQFVLERLGIWRIDDYAAVFTATEWKALGSEGPADGVKPKALAVDMSHDRQISVAACWHTDGGGLFAEEVWAGADSRAAVEWIRRRAGCRIPVLIDNGSKSPGASMVPLLAAARVKVKTTGAADASKACGLVFDMVKDGTLRHGDGPGQEALAAAVIGARKRPIRDVGGFGWDRRDDSVNIAPLVAFTLAVLGASAIRRRSGGESGSRGDASRRSSSGRRRAVLL